MWVMESKIIPLSWLSSCLFTKSGVFSKSPFCIHTQNESLFRKSKGIDLHWQYNEYVRIMWLRDMSSRWVAEWHTHIVHRFCIHDSFVFADRPIL